MSALTPIQAVRSLVAYGLRTELIEKDDAVFTANMLFDVLGIEPDSEFTPFGGKDLPLEDILAALLDDAVARGHIEDGIASRDLFDTKLMGCLTPRPSEVVRTFKALYQESPKQATDYFYKVSRDSDYIRTYRIKKDRKWVTKTRYGELDITINLSKPEQLRSRRSRMHIRAACSARKMSATPAVSTTPHARRSA